MAKVIRSIFKIRRGLAEAWEKNNPILEYGELGFDKDNYILKIGDGERGWLKLPSIGKNIQPNWDQWDSTQPDFVKNRTHYINKYYKPESDIYHFDVTDVSQEFEIKGYYTPSEAMGVQYRWKKIRVVCNGKEYLIEDRIRPDDDGSFIYRKWGAGNFSLRWPEEEDTGEPFLILGTRPSSKIIFAEEGSYKIEITEQEMTSEIVPLQEEFMPPSWKKKLDKIKVNSAGAMLLLSTLGLSDSISDSFGAGRGIELRDDDTFIIGHYNKQPSYRVFYSITSADGVSMGYSTTNQIFMVGNGKDSQNRSNAFTISTDGVPWSQNRPQFGGNEYNDGSQTVMANGDEEIVLKCNGEDYIIDVTSNGVIKAMKMICEPKIKLKLNTTSGQTADLDFDIYIKNINKKLITSIKLSYYLYYYFPQTSGKEFRQMSPMIQNSYEREYDYFGAIGVKFSGNGNSNFSYSDCTISITYNDLNGEEHIYSQSLYNGTTEWIDIGEDTNV